MNGSLKFRTVLMIMAVIASAMTVLFVLHAETDNSSAEVVESGWCGPDASYCIYSDGILQINGSGEMYSYEYVHAPWYEYRDDITKIIISDNITQLGSWAFVGLKHVTELIIPISLNSVVSDLYPAFAGCYNIEKINFTYGTNGCGYNYSAYSGFDSWYQNTPWYQSRDVLKDISFAYWTEYIGSDTFRELNITTLVIPDTVGSLGNHCFYNCTKLTDLTIPVSLNPVGNETYPAFDGCYAVQNFLFTYGNGVPYDYTNWHDVDTDMLNRTPWMLNPSVVKNITIASNIVDLGEYMFYQCNIGSLVVPISISCWYNFYNHDYDIYDYPSLKSVHFTPGGLRGYSCDTAIQCPWNLAVNLETITFDEGITHIGAYYFYNCKANTIIFPGTLHDFGDGVFYYCKVKNMVFPINTNFGTDDARYLCDKMSGLEKVTFIRGSGIEGGIGYNFTDNSDNSSYLYTPWYVCRSSLKEIVFEDGITYIGTNAFRDLNITSLVIPNSVKSLGERAFCNCDKLIFITIPITLDCAGSGRYSAIDQCNSINTLRFTAGTDGIGVDYNDGAPFWCNPFHKPSLIIFDGGIRYIGNQAFAGYTFIGSDGEVLQPTAECLSGHVFEKRAGVMCQTDALFNGNLEDFTSACPAGSEVKADLQELCYVIGRY